MKISRGFVKLFLAAFLLVIIWNIAGYFMNFYDNYMMYTLLVFVFVLLFLIFRKRLSAGFKSATFKLIKWIVIIAVVVVLGYFIWTYFASGNSFNSFYDIGGLGDEENPYLAPSSRISEIFNESEENATLTYRNLLSQLVYFGATIPRGSDIIDIDMRVKNQFPRKGEMFIGAGVSKDWNYTSHLVYNRTMFRNASDGWIVLSTQFNIKDLYLEKGALVLLIDTPHLGEDFDEDQVIPVDWINVTVKKFGLFDSISSFDYSRLRFWDNINFTKLAFWKNNNTSDLNQTINNTASVNLNKSKTAVKNETKTINKSASSPSSEANQTINSSINNSAL